MNGTAGAEEFIQSRKARRAANDAVAMGRPCSGGGMTTPS